MTNRRIKLTGHAFDTANTVVLEIEKLLEGVSFFVNFISNLGVVFSENIKILKVFNRCLYPPLKILIIELKKNTRIHARMYAYLLHGGCTDPGL